MIAAICLLASTLGGLPAAAQDAAEGDTVTVIGTWDTWHIWEVSAENIYSNTMTENEVTFTFPVGPGVVTGTGLMQAEWDWFKPLGDGTRPRCTTVYTSAWEFAGTHDGEGWIEGTAVRDDAPLVYRPSSCPELFRSTDTFGKGGPASATFTAIWSADGGSFAGQVTLESGYTLSFQGTGTVSALTAEDVDAISDEELDDWAEILCRGQTSMSDLLFSFDPSDDKRPLSERGNTACADDHPLRMRLGSGLRERVDDAGDDQLERTVALVKHLTGLMGVNLAMRATVQAALDAGQEPVDSDFSPVSLPVVPSYVAGLPIAARLLAGGEGFDPERSVRATNNWLRGLMRLEDARLGPPPTTTTTTPDA